MPSKIMSGARAKLHIITRDSSGKDTARTVGIFSNVSYALTYDAAPAFILGRYSPAEIEYTGQEAVSVTASGWRVIDHGPHAVAGMPALKDLFNHEYMSMTILDRQNNKTIAKIQQVRPTGYSTSITSRALEEITMTFVGILASDETIEDNVEASNSTNLLDNA